VFVENIVKLCDSLGDSERGLYWHAVLDALKR
jgi:hypothetical protein